MAAPRTTEEALHQMRVIWFSILVSIPLYLYAGDVVGAIPWLSFPSAGKVFIVLAVLNLYYAFWFRRSRYLPAVIAIQDQPENVHAVRRWMSSWTVLICMAESEAVYGFAFRMGNKRLAQSLPFSVVAAIWTLWLWPRQAWVSDEIAGR